MHNLIHSVYTMQNVYFMKILSPKKHGQLSFDNKCYQDTFLVSFTVTSANTNTAIHNEEQISSPF